MSALFLIASTAVFPTVSKDARGHLLMIDKMNLNYFTQEEANALLPVIEPLMAELVERRGYVVSLAKEAGDVLKDVRSNVGGPALSELTQEFMAIERLIGEIQAHGCLVKDINVGLVDFLANRNGRDVYLCWRYGETAVDHYHDLHTGFNDRRLA